MSTDQIINYDYSTSYLSSNIIVFPTSNSLNEGRLTIEDNMKSIVTRITTRNYTLLETDFEVTKVSNNTINVSKGQANINGYHVNCKLDKNIILDGSKYSEGTYKVYLQLVYDNSNHVQGVATEAGGTSEYFKGLALICDNSNLSEKSESTLLLATLEWDGSTITNIINNANKTFSINSDKIYINNIKYNKNSITNNLQTFLDNIHGTFLNKYGDTSFGELYIGNESSDSYYTMIGKSIIKLKPLNTNSLSSILELNSTSSNNSYIKFNNTFLINSDVSKNKYSYNYLSIGSNSYDDLLNITNPTKLMSLLEIYDKNNNSNKLIVDINNSEGLLINAIRSTNKFKSVLNDNEIKLITNLNDSSIFNLIHKDNKIQLLGNNSLKTTNTMYGTNFTYSTNNLCIDISNIDLLLGNTSKIISNNLCIGLYGNDKFYTKFNGDGTFNISGILSYSNKTTKQLDILTDLYAKNIHITESSLYFGKSRIYKSTDNNNNINYINISDNTNISGNLDVTGNITGAKVFNAVYNDYAELYLKDNINEVIEPGDVIVLNPYTGKYTKSSSIESKYVIGVCSNSYGILLGGDKDKSEEENLKLYIPIGLTGRILVKTDNVDIKPGDLLVSDSNGKATIADNYIPGCIIGKSLGYPNNGKVLMQIMLQ